MAEQFKAIVGRHRHEPHRLPLHRASGGDRPEGARAVTMSTPCSGPLRYPSLQTELPTVERRRRRSEGAMALDRCGVPLAYRRREPSQDPGDADAGGATPMTPGDPSELLSFRRLSAKQEGLRIPSFAADLERTEILPPEPVRSLRFRLTPPLQSIEVLDRDLALAQAVEQVVAEGGGQVGPLDLRHHSPKVMRASSSLSRFCSAGLDERCSRSASSKNRFFSRCWPSKPASIRSTTMRFALVFFVFASAFTRRATRGGRLMLWRMGFSTFGMNFRLHHLASECTGRSSKGPAPPRPGGARAGHDVQAKRPIADRLTR